MSRKAARSSTCSISEFRLGLTQVYRVQMRSFVRDWAGCVQVVSFAM